MWVELDVYCRYVVFGCLNWVGLSVLDEFKFRVFIVMMMGVDWFCVVYVCGVYVVILLIIDEVVRIMDGVEFCNVEDICLLWMLNCGIGRGIVMRLVCSIFIKVMMYLRFCGVNIVIWLLFDVYI